MAVTRKRRERTEEYHRLKRRDSRVITLEDFTDADIAALEAIRAPESAKVFDDELNLS